MRHTITVVGIGPGDPAYLLPQARAAIHDARVLVGARSPILLMRGYVRMRSERILQRC